MPQQRIDLGPGQRGGGLVHEQQPRIGGEAAADRDHLALGDRQRRHRRIERQAEAEPRRAARARPARMRPQRHRAGEARQVLVEGDVLGHREVREQRQVLVDDLDAQRLGQRPGRAARAPRRRSRSGCPGRARCTPATSLISVDLPQPFSPTRQCTSPGSTSQSIRSSAITPPKRLLTPVSRRNGAIGGIVVAGAPCGAPSRCVRGPCRPARRWCPC